VATIVNHRSPSLGCRRWCEDVLDELHGTEHGACSFVDLTQLGHKGGYCSRHQKHCPIPACDLLVSGFSCKDLSRANPNRKALSASQVVGASSSPGKTADTLVGTMVVIDTVVPEIIVLENVDLEQDEEHSLGLDRILQELGGRGYDTHAFLMNSASYGLPQHRIRLFIIAILSPGRRFKMTNFISFWSRFQNLIEKCKMVGPDIVDAVLPPSSPWLAKELSIRSSSSAKGWDSSTIQAHRQEWLRAGTIWGSAEAQPDKADRDSEWFGGLPARAKDVLAYTTRTWQMHDGPLVGVDVSQSIGRAPTARQRSVEGRSPVIVPTILPNTVMWLLPLHRPVIGCESLALQVTQHGYCCEHSSLFMWHSQVDIAHICFQALIYT
jgi:site-specific DNA-cytosine methylase